MIGKRIDIDHPDSREYAHKKGVDLTAPSKQMLNPTKRGPKTPSSKQQPYVLPSQNPAAPPQEETPLPAPDPDVGKYMTMTLRDLLGVFATDLRFSEWMKGAKALMEIRTKDLKLRADAGELVDRRIVAVGVFEPFDSAFRRLLADAPKAISTQATALAKAGAGIEEIEDLVRQILTSHIRPAKQKARQTIEKIGGFDDEPEQETEVA